MGSRISRLETGPESVELGWEDGKRGEYHYMWLRDNCGCTDCRHPDTWERLFDLLTVPEDIKPVQAKITEAGDLRLTWPGDGHVSDYPTGWLRENCYAGDVDIEKVSRSQWDSALTGKLPEASHGAVLADDAAFLAWLTALRQWGVALLRDMPSDLGAARAFAENIGPLRPTNFGTEWNVISMPNPNSNAYTDLKLTCHTDLPNWEVPPGYQFLHCLVNEAEGGQSVLVDGFRVAEELRATEPEAFDLLSRVPLDYRFRDKDTDIYYRAPAIRLGPDGEVTEIRFSIAVMGTLKVPGHLMAGVYGAHRKFAQLLRDPRFEVRFRLDPGDMMVFDNRRVLHGRTAFNASTGHRRLRGIYVDHDVLDSRIRVLQHTANGMAATGTGGPG